MVRLNVIYTRTGDKGESGLGDGSRRPKTDARFVAMGDVDETNCAIGLARLATRGSTDPTLAAIEPTLAHSERPLRPRRRPLSAEARRRGAEPGVAHRGLAGRGAGCDTQLGKFAKLLCCRFAIDRPPDSK